MESWLPRGLSGGPIQPLIHAGSGFALRGSGLVDRRRVTLVLNGDHGPAEGSRPAPDGANQAPEGGRLGLEEAWEDVLRQQELLRKRAESKRQKAEDQETLWREFMEAEGGGVAAGEDGRPQQGLLRKRAESKRQKAEDQETLWREFMEAERREIAQRQNGQLARLLGEPLPGELPAALKRLAAHDQMQAERGLAALMSGEVPR